jgi:aminoglycoside 6'-N-acetyltransferase I
VNHPDIKIIDLQPDNEDAIQQVADLLFRGFCEHNPNGWPTLKAALKEVRKSLRKERISRIAVDKNNKVLGWVGGIHEYSYVWELHPIVVEPEYQGKGIGRALVKDLDEQVKERGGITIRIGADDEDYMTTVSGIDLYPNVLEHLAKIKNIKGHPYEFYQKQGFTVVGVIPDADGIGKPDIIMAKRVAKR